MFCSAVRHVRVRGGTLLYGLRNRDGQAAGLEKTSAEVKTTLGEEAQVSALDRARTRRVNELGCSV